MITFTYKDYLEYANLENICLREESRKYELNTIQEEKTHQYADKIFKEILSNKKEFIKFLQRYIDSKDFADLVEEDIEKYNKEFITSKFKKKESDIIYKIANRNMYILLEHQSKVDYTMPKRITEYCIELMGEIQRNSKNKILSRPVIIPIVLYTGEQHWNVEYKIPIIEQYKYIVFEYQRYNLIDINKFTNEELIEENTGLSKALLFEKVKTKEELKEAIDKIMTKCLTAEESQYIQVMLMYSNKIRKFMPEERAEYIKKLEKGGKEIMRFEKFFIEILQDEKREGERIGEKRGEKRGEKIGIAKAIKQMVKEMLKNNISDEQIMKIAKIDQKELEKLKIA